MTGHVYTEEERQFLKEFIPGHTRKEIQEAFNDRFGCDISIKAVGSYMEHHKIKNGFDGRFRKGHIPANKGKKYSNPKLQSSIGSEFIDSRGYIKIKIAQPNKWVLKHRYIWEQFHGPIPDGYMVAFRDNNRQNVDVNNLMLVSRSQGLVLNRHLGKYPEELKDTALLLVDLKIATSKKRKELKNENH